MSRVIIAGSRDFNDFEMLFEEMYVLLDSGYEITEVVCGEARGADTLGKKWATGAGIPVKSFPANWDKWGKAAGYIRNKEMAKYADIAVLFWDGVSKGTGHMRELMLKEGKEVVTILTKHKGCVACQG